MEQLKCAVCCDGTTVKTYHHVLACVGCRSFIKRTIAEQKTYICSKHGDCLVNKDSRNKCRACRFNKCISAGLLVETHCHWLSKSLPDLSALPPAEQSPQPSTETSKLIKFLSSMTETCTTAWDPKFGLLTKQEWTKMDQVYGRNVSLLEGLKDPEKVCPRTRWDWSVSRPAGVQDIGFMWFRFFVLVADYANSVPEFQQLSESDQNALIRSNLINVAVLFNMYFWVQNIASSSSVDAFPTGNGSFVEKFNESGLLGSLDAYESYIYKPFLDLDLDTTDVSILAAIRLFDYHEGLSPEGREMAEGFLDRLYDALVLYQTTKLEGRPRREGIRRLSKLLMIMVRITQIRTMESDVQMMLSTFEGLNIDGIPKELLLNERNCR